MPQVCEVPPAQVLKASGRCPLLDSVNVLIVISSQFLGGLIVSVSFMLCLGDYVPTPQIESVTASLSPVHPSHAFQMSVLCAGKVLVPRELSYVVQAILPH